MSIWKEKKQGMRVYLDHNATAPLRVEARAAMIAAMDLVGNPSSVHAEGRAARALVERARAQVAAAFGAEGAEVIFTSGATEAAALACAGRGLLGALVEHDAVGAWVSGDLLGLGLISPGVALLAVIGSVARAWFVARVDVREAGLVVRSLWRWSASTTPWHQIIDLRGGVYARSGYVKLLLGTGRSVATRVCLDPMRFARLERTIQLRAIEQPFA